MNQPSTDFAALCHALVKELGLALEADITAIEALAGGVSSDIARVRIGERWLCIKAALPKLKVAADWRAPTHRNDTEYRWLSWVRSVRPDAVPQLYGQSTRLGAFAMQWLDPDQHRNWKSQLLAGLVDGVVASQVGETLARIHQRSTEAAFDTKAFQQKADFFALRLEPYLETIVRVHPDLTMPVRAEIERLDRAQIALVHGDISPKNILIGPRGPILLDAECAVMGDPAFDIAFCLNHALLKALHLPAQRAALLALVPAFWQAYAAGVQWESPAALEARVARLLPMLLLARVDGKSPVEYLDETERARLRPLARDLIAYPAPDLHALVERFNQGCTEPPA